MFLRGVAWVSSSVVKANDVHPLTECSNRGLCDRKTGLCMCSYDYEGLACERTTCPYDCNMNGVCYSQRELADNAGAVYSTPWDANKQMGCLCDYGFRGYDCSQIECLSGPDPLKGFGNEAGRDCSGRGICNYLYGTCRCFSGFFGNKCQNQVG